MSTTPSLASLLQQDISIVTVKELRYQGKLYSYDTAKLTITLQDVHCFGTEQRVTSSPVPPRRDVFQFIVFNASQIKSFVPIAKNDGFSDPAIVATMDGNAGAPSRNKRNSPRGPSAGPQAPNSVMRMFDNGFSQLHTVDVSRIMGQQQRQHQNQQQANRSNKKNSKRGNKSNQNDGAHQKSNGNQNRNQNKNPRHVSFKSENAKLTEGERRQFTRVPQIPRKALNRKNRRNGNQQSKTATETTPGRFAPRETPMKFDEEFDFEKALEEFKELSVNEKANKDKSATEATGEDGSKATEAAADSNKAGQTEPSEPVYNQDKSFYDNLTTTVDNDAKQRPSRKEAMQTNKETFGVAFLPGRRFRHRNGMLQRYNNNGNNNRAGGRRHNFHQQRQQNGETAFEQMFRRMVSAY